MPDIPDLSWKELSAEELKAELKKKGPLDIYDKAFIELVKEQKVKAFLKPNGEISYQYKQMGKGT